MPVVVQLARRLRHLVERYRIDRRLPPPVRALAIRTAQLRIADRIARARAGVRPLIRPLGASDGSVCILDGRRVATVGALDRPVSDLATWQADRVVSALEPGFTEGGLFLVGRERDRLVLGSLLEHRDHASVLLADLDPPGWIVRWHDRGRTGLVDASELASHRRARLARCWEVFRPLSWGDRMVSDSAATVLTFWAIGTSGQRELVGTRGHERFDDRSPVTSESVDGVDFPGRSAFPVATDLAQLAQPVDVVVTWVDGGDPVWLESFGRTAAQFGRTTGDSALDPARFRSRDELRYVLRSIWAYCGWVGQIYLVTAGQRPEWLGEHDRLTVVDHREILPADALPTFNSHAIEASLHHIDGLSECFVYFNDDMFVARPLRPETFFTSNGLARVFSSGARVPGFEDAETQHVDTAALRGRRLMQERFGRVPVGKPFHSPYPLRRSTLDALELAFCEEVDATRRSRFRSPEDVSVAASLGQYYGIATGASVFGDISTEYVYVESDRLGLHLDRILLADDIDTFCINETADRSGDHDQRETRLAEFFEAAFPVPAPWEVDVV